MSEIGDIFAGHREGSILKRARNRETSRRLLSDAGVSFTIHNDGAHLIVERRWDFWPGTGKWIDRRGGKYRRGVFLLLAAIHRTKAERTR